MVLRADEFCLHETFTKAFVSANSILGKRIKLSFKPFELITIKYDHKNQQISYVNLW